MPAGHDIGRLVEIELEVLGPRGRAQASHFFAGGTQATARISTRLGYRVEATPEHRLWVRHPDGSEGWKPVGTIVPGDFVAIERQLELWGSQVSLEVVPARFSSRTRQPLIYRLPSEMDEDLAYLAGLLIGDGTLTYRNSFDLSTVDAFIADEFCRIVDRLFGYKAGAKANGKDYFVTSVQLRDFLAQLGLDYVRAHEKRVPRSILQAPRPIIVAFLQGLFDTDGYADNHYGNVYISSASAELAHEVHLLLLNCGIIASLHVKPTKSRPTHLISIYGPEAIAFHTQIGFRLPRKQIRKELASSLRMPNIGGIPNLDVLLKQVQARIVATSNKPVALKRDKSINSIFYTYIPSGRNISYRKLDELVAYCHDNGVACPELETIQSQRYFYDPVVAIQPGEAEVYDLCVADDHAYVANGFVSHNSTFIRQTAMIVLMAQIGSYVPAESAHIGLVDRIFTRIGASDEIARGQSTFMVEMVETANILHHATNRSLLILDEIGRGTSTYDGLAIAWAVVEYLHNHPRLRAKTLFATHYHELTDLAERLPNVANFNVAVTEHGDNVVFLHRIVPGAADRSYGVHVAQMAGLPRAVINRAEEILGELEASGAAGPRRSAAAPAIHQLTLFSSEDPILADLKALDVNALSPLDALNKLYEWQQRLKPAEGGAGGVREARKGAERRR
jgi:DNA mismatch repair protein MutS